MLILLGLLAITVLGYFLSENGYDFIGSLALIFGGASLFIAIVVLGAVHLETKGQVAHYNEVLVSIENMQDANVSESEVIVLSQKIIEVNTFIAEAKAYNEGLLDIFIPDKVAELEPIRYDK